MMWDLRPITEDECHLNNNRRILDGNGCRCYLPNGLGFLPCPDAALRALPLHVHEALRALPRGEEHGGFLPSPSDFAAQKPRRSYTGDVCRQCGSPNMVRTGTCMTCQECASSDGGCS